MKHTNIICLICLICEPLCCTGFLSSCTVVDERQSGNQQPVRCEVMTVQSNASISHYTYMATVQAEAHIPLSLPLGGTLTELCVRPNAQVSKGDILLRVDDTQARQALAAAKAALTQAQDAMRRTTPLHDKGLITDIQMVELQTKLDQAQAAVAAAERQVQQCTLTAPKSGVVTFNNLNVGQHLAPEVTIITLLDMSGFTALIHVPEAEVAAMHPDDEATLAIPAIRADSLDARLSQIGVQANSLTHTYPVEALISNPPATMLPGMVGTLTVMQHEHAAISIPQRCVTLLPEGASVWVVNDSNRAERRRVTLGIYRADGVQVLSGLNNGDRLVTAGYQKLYIDAPVAY